MLLAIFGREPELSLAELESRLGPTAMKPLGHTGALLDIDKLPLDFTHIGGIVKVVKIIETLHTSSWLDVKDFAQNKIDFCQIFNCELNHKFSLGISVNGIKARPADITKLGITLKKRYSTESGHKIRVVPNKSGSMSSAQVLHNRLYDRSYGAELYLACHQGQTFIGLTQEVQDIEAYSKRDFGRPCRNAKVGMLPPKLAQIIINLALGKTSQDSKTVVLDPFCGTGVVLQEISLMGYYPYGSDLGQNMIECAKANLKWLMKTSLGNIRHPQLEQADATKHLWSPLPDCIATETYLGQPLVTLPDPQNLNMTVDDANAIITKFLRNLTTQTKPAFRLCVAIPAWQIAPRRFRTLEVLDDLVDLGYNWVRFSHVNSKKLFYARPGQIVGRQLITLERI